MPNKIGTSRKKFLSYLRFSVEEKVPWLEKKDVDGRQRCTFRAWSPCSVTKERLLVFVFWRLVICLSVFVPSLGISGGNFLHPFETTGL